MAYAWTKLSYPEAVRLTQEIKESAERTHDLLLRAHNQRAWEVMGYKSWREYAVEEFQVSQRRAYQLLEYAQVMQEIEGAAPDCTMVQKPNERQARELAQAPEGQRAEVWQKVVDITDGKPTAAAVREVVQPDAPRAVPDVTTLRNPFNLPESPPTQEVPAVPTPVLTEPRLSPEEAEQRRRERVATDLITSVLVPLSRMAYTDGVQYYRPEIATPHPISGSILERCQIALNNIREELNQRGLL